MAGSDRNYKTSKKYHVINCEANYKISTNIKIFELLNSLSLSVTAYTIINVSLTDLCSSPSLILKLCSNTEYMTRPTPNEGSITDGTISSTARVQYKVDVKI